MATHDRNMLKRADVEPFQAWLDENKLVWRKGKGEYQLVQVKLATGWGAICTDAKSVITTPPALREMIQRFQKGLPYTGKIQRQDDDQDTFIDDLRDDFAMAAMQARAAGDYSAWGDLAADAYNIAEAMLAERAKRISK